MTLENSNETSPLSLIMNESRKLWLSTKCRGFLVRSNLHVKKQNNSATFMVFVRLSIKIDLLSFGDFNIDIVDHKYIATFRLT